MRNVSELFRPTVRLTTALLALSTVMMPHRAWADPACWAAGEMAGQNCAPLGGNCEPCVWVACGDFAQGDGSCYSGCVDAGAAFCS